MTVIKNGLGAVDDELRRGLLDIVTAGMKERVEGEIWTLWEIESVRTPGNGGELRIENWGLRFLFVEFPGVQSDADGWLLVESLEEAWEAVMTKDFLRVAQEFRG